MRVVSLIIFIFLNTFLFAQEEVFRIGVAGLTHDHVHWVLNRHADSDLEIVGIVETNPELIQRYRKQYNLDESLFFPTVKEMISKTKPEAVCAFNSISKHIEVIRACAPRGVHVMVEKPLAFNLSEAKEIEELSARHNIHILTNYETTWYPSSVRVFELTRNNSEIGPIRKVVIHDGHKGPIEIGCSKEFTNWLTDPKYNGAGALVDFGCYGANLITWLYQGKRPDKITAVTQQFKPEIYPDVDDEATIILTYGDSQCIIQASWNWPFNRKDMRVYGTRGYIFADDANTLRIKNDPREPEEVLQVLPLKNYHSDPFTQLRDVVRGDFTLPPFHPSSLENNLIVVEILAEAIKQSTIK